MMQSIKQDTELYLLVDGGKSKTEAVIVDSNGSEMAKSRGPGLEIIGSVNGLESVTSTDSTPVCRTGVAKRTPARHIGRYHRRCE